MKTAAASAPPPTLRVEKGRTVQVEYLPGRVVELPAMEVAGVAKFVICALKKQADGRYILVPQEWRQFVRVTDRLCQDLGLPCTQRQLRRLAKAGFIEASQVTPRGLVASVPSIIGHFYRCRVVEGKESWWTKKRLDAFFNAQVALTLEEEEDEEEEAPKARKKAKTAAKTAEAGQMELWAA